MSDDTTTTEMIRASAESRTWAEKLMTGVRAVEALHTPEPFETQEEGTVVGCKECSKLAGDEVEPWPCDTAKALGIEDGPLL